MPFQAKAILRYFADNQGPGARRIHAARLKRDGEREVHALSHKDLSENSELNG